MQQTREEIYELARIAEKQHTWTALQPNTRTYRTKEMTTKLQELHHAIASTDLVVTAQDWTDMRQNPRRAIERLRTAARAIVIEHTVTQEIQQFLSGKEWDSIACAGVAEILSEHGYHVREVEPTLAPNNAPAEVIAAVMEVQRHYPEVESVIYDLEGSWCYRDSDGTQLTFGAEVSTDILGLGADAAPKPSVYFLVEG